MIDAVFGDLRLESLILYLDDLQIISITFSEHIKRLKEVLRRFRAANLKANSSKSCFAAELLKFLDT